MCDDGSLCLGRDIVRSGLSSSFGLYNKNAPFVSGVFLPKRATMWTLVEDIGTSFEEQARADTLPSSDHENSLAA
jgi:hypothetical protein